MLDSDGSVCRPVADNNGVVALPSTSAPATNTDDQFEDYSKIWCYILYIAS